MENSDDLPHISTPLIGSIYHHTWSYIAFIWLGLGTVLPFNFFITADPYFRHKLHDPASLNASMSRLELLYENSVTICASLTNLITVILVTYIYVPYMNKYRINMSLCGITICLFACFTLTFINVKNWRAIFFAITMVLVMIQSIFSAVLLNCFFSLASTLPSRYIQGFISGQALGGVFVVICSILSILLSSNISTSAAIYFLLAILVLISNLIVYFFLDKSHLFQIYSSAVQEINNDREAFFHESSSYNDDNQILSITSVAVRQRLYVAYGHIKWNFFGVFLTFVCTLSLFPAYLAKIQPAYPSINYSNPLWTVRLYAQVMTFLLFYMGDLLGRTISSKVHKPSLLYPRFLFFLSLSRFVFIVLFGFCHFPNSNGFPYVFKHDAIYMVLVLAFAMSHGYCSSLNMMYAPRRVHTQLSSTVGALMTMALTMGTFVGSVLSFGIVTLYGDDTPSGNLHLH